ncbi:restriction endonuclease subunit S [Streptomyces sp. NPDC051286]|uniref:restriction endonuclease subunit S n=1 Tax=Streptomyces sp. NPDC051286 TaxID=3365647 RepID=UPI0037BD6A12
MTSPEQRLKYFYRVTDQRAGEDQPPLLAVSIHHGVVPRSTLTDDLPRAEDLSNYKLCEQGDIVLNRMRAFQGAIGVSSVRGLVSPDYLVLRPGPSTEVRYLHHLFRSKWFVGEMSSRLRGIGGTENGAVRTPRINPEDLGDIRVALPSLEEQRRIADFLDTETARIDRLADRYQKLSNLSIERAQVVIDKALMGFSEESAVPASTVCSAIVDCVNKTAPTSTEVTPYKMIRTSNIRNGDVDLTETFSVGHQVFIEWNRRGAPQNGDILFTREAPLGQVGMLRTDASVFLGQRIVLYRANENVIKKELLLYNFLGSHMDRQLRLLGAGSLHEHMRVGDCLKLRIYCPPRTQQDGLVAEIEAGRAKSLRLAKLAKRQLALLAERRQALITAAVTGQFDVSTASGRNVTDGVSA